MDETDFKETFKETLQFINQNLKRKGGFMNSSNINDGCIKGKLRKEKQWYILKVNLDQVFISKETVDLISLIHSHRSQIILAWAVGIAVGRC